MTGRSQFISASGISNRDSFLLFLLFRSADFDYICEGYFCKSRGSAPHNSSITLRTLSGMFRKLLLQFTFAEFILSRYFLSILSASGLDLRASMCISHHRDLIPDQVSTSVNRGQELNIVDVLSPGLHQVLYGLYGDVPDQPLHEDWPPCPVYFFRHSSNSTAERHHQNGRCLHRKASIVNLNVNVLSLSSCKDVD